MTPSPAPFEPAHVHRWRIEPQGEKSSTGLCTCGEVRQFQNGWEVESRPYRLNGRTGRAKPGHRE